MPAAFRRNPFIETPAMKTVSPSKPRRALVIGASMAGLFATALLRRAGWDAQVFDRTPVELFGRGAGIVTHDELLQALDLSGACLRDLGITVEERIALGRDGRVVERLPFRQIVTSWDRLHQILRATVPNDIHHLDHDLIALEQTTEGVTARFANGRVEHGDLLIGADGYRSAVRRHYLPDIQPIYAEYVIWRGVAEERDISATAHDAIFDRLVFYLPPYNKVIGYPIAGPDNDLRFGHRRFNWVWYRPLSRSLLPDMLRDEAGVQYDVSIPPPKVRQELINELRRCGAEVLPRALNDVLASIKRPFFTPIYDFTTPQLAFGRVALIGDAAALARPHIGMGVSKAASDAVVLSECLADTNIPVPEALARFNASRLPIGERTVRRGRDLGAYMLPHTREDEADISWEQFHSIHGILTHTASSAFLRAEAAATAER
jgi:2-polyprenyl-6-methoxyphenol hydroxylase-like FAD-dependent oxidoreductase